MKFDRDQPMVGSKQWLLGEMALESNHYSEGSGMGLYLVITALDIVRILLERDGNWSVRELVEASVHLPSRGHRWIAVFTGPEPGKQIWRSTGLLDYDAALALAKKWEAEARALRLARRVGALSAPLRVGRRQINKTDDALPQAGPLSQRQVALILKLSERAVRQIEKRALSKLRAHPELRKLMREYFTGEIGETLCPFEIDSALTQSEIEALLGLVHTPLERRALHRILQFIGAR